MIFCFPTGRAWPRGQSLTGRNLPDGPRAFSFFCTKERKRLAKERNRQRKPFEKGFLWTLSKNRGAAAPQTPRGCIVGTAPKSFDLRRRGRCLHRPGGRYGRNVEPFGEFDGAQWADVGIGPYEAVRFCRRISPNETVQICTAPQPRRRVQSKALCAADEDRRFAARQSDC